MANSTLRKFGYPDSLVRELDHWAVLVRPAQPTLGSLVLCARGDATAFSELPVDAFSELAHAVKAIETALTRFSSYERLNYLMLMMVDPHVHFHVVPRYSTPRNWGGLSFADAGWPGPPDLKQAVTLSDQQIVKMGGELGTLF